MSLIIVIILYRYMVLFSIYSYQRGFYRMTQHEWIKVWHQLTSIESYVFRFGRYSHLTAHTRVGGWTSFRSVEDLEVGEVVGVRRLGGHKSVNTQEEGWVTTKQFGPWVPIGKVSTWTLLRTRKERPTSQGSIGGQRNPDTSQWHSEDFWSTHPAKMKE